MNKTAPPQVTLPELVRYWRNLLDSEDVPPESEYRIRKLIDRSGPLVEKIFLKTARGREMVSECAEQTRLFRSHLGFGDERLYRALTELEMTYQDLLKTAYEFRVKAG
jgi:hypothetical protein